MHTSTALISGGLAGTATDTLLFPLDTLRTRLQSSTVTFSRRSLSQLFKNLYRGLPSVIAASAPSAALFFTSYEYSKRNLYFLNDTAKHMLSASIGEMVACLIRVPSEVIKQHSQVNIEQKSTIYILKKLINDNGPFVLYRGYLTALTREIPFTCIQFPLFEYFKKQNFITSNSNNAAISGAMAGSIAGCITTPLDFLKTNIVLSGNPAKKIIIEVWRKNGFSGFWKGVVPRTLWIGIGGSIFLGCYDTVANFIEPLE